MSKAGLQHVPLNVYLQHFTAPYIHQTLTVSCRTHSEEASRVSGLQSHQELLLLLHKKQTQAMLQLLHPISLNEKEPLRSACARVWTTHYDPERATLLWSGTRRLKTQPSSAFCSHLNGFASGTA